MARNYRSIRVGDKVYRWLAWKFDPITFLTIKNDEQTKVFTVERQLTADELERWKRTGVPKVTPAIVEIIIRRYIQT